jgi:COMPASS component SWD3
MEDTLPKEQSLYNSIPRNSVNTNSDAYYKNQIDKLGRENKQLKQRLDILEKENKNLKKSLFELSIQYVVELRYTFHLNETDWTQPRKNTQILGT